MLSRLVPNLNVDIYYNDDNVVKSHVYRAIMQTPGVYNIFTVMDKPSHRLKRRIVGQAINDRSMRTFEPTMLEQIDLFLKTVLASSKESKPINLTEHIGYLACDIIALLSLGFPLRLQTNPEYRWMVDGMFRANYLANVRVQQYRLHQFRVFSLLKYLTRDVRERWKRLLEKMIITRSSEDKHIRHDLYSIAAKANSQGETIRMSELWSEVITFFPAGAMPTIAFIPSEIFANMRQARFPPQLPYAHCSSTCQGTPSAIENWHMNSVPRSIAHPISEQDRSYRVACTFVLVSTKPCALPLRSQAHSGVKRRRNLAINP